MRVALAGGADKVRGVDLFAALDQAARQPATPKRKPLSRAAQDAMKKKRREDAERLPHVRKRLRELAPDFPWDAAQCAAPCPTVLGWRDDPADLCAGCRWALARAGIVVPGA